jgi:hypothetical protein
MKIIAIIFLASILNCSSPQIVNSEFTPSYTEGCISEKTSNARLKCLSNWLRTQENKSNAEIVSTEHEGERIDSTTVKVVYTHCSTNKDTKEVFECINHSTTKYKPTKLREFYDRVEPYLALVVGVIIGGLL